jgi:reverse gyrase
MSIYNKTLRNSTIFYFTSCVPGSGKTFGAMKYVVQQAKHGACYAIVMPTIALIRKSYDDLLSMHPEVAAFTTKFTGDDGSVVYRVSE